jgi:PhnB protein
MHIEPYLFFEGRCEEAIEHYRKTLGATVESFIRFRDSPEPNNGMIPPGSENKIMHASFRVGDSRINCSDGMCHGKAVFQGVSIVIETKTDAEAERVFNALSEGGTVHQPLIRAFFSSRFGMLADKFGVAWMIMAGKVNVGSAEGTPGGSR